MLTLVFLPFLHVIVQCSCWLPSGHSSLYLVYLPQFWLPVLVPAVTLTWGHPFFFFSSVRILTMLQEVMRGFNDLWNFWFPSSPESSCVHCTPFLSINYFMQLSHKIEKIRIKISESWKDAYRPWVTTSIHFFRWYSWGSVTYCYWL